MIDLIGCMLRGSRAQRGQAFLGCSSVDPVHLLKQRSCRLPRSNSHRAAVSVFAVLSAWSTSCEREHQQRCSYKIETIASCVRNISEYTFL